MAQLHDGHLREHVCSFKLSKTSVEGLLRESKDELPEVIYPEIRILTADKPTRNLTIYPEASLRGKNAKGTGLISFNRPYPVPVIKDHNTHGGMGMESSEVYGRFFRPVTFVLNKGEGYLRGVPAITHKEAIEAVLSQRWLTVSLGSRTESVQCSICNTELTREWCDHIKGDPYKREGSKKEEICHWIVGPIQAKEVSFVVTPSDEQAGVLTPNLEEGVSRETGAGGIERILAGCGSKLYDLRGGQLLQESFYQSSPAYPARRGAFHFYGGEPVQ